MEFSLSSLSLLVIVSLFSCFDVHMYNNMQMYFLHTFVHPSVSVCVCVCVFAAERTQGGKSNVVAMELYPWCRNYGNKAWKDGDLIGISGAVIQNSNP